MKSKTARDLIEIEDKIDEVQRAMLSLEMILWGKSASDIDMVRDCIEQLRDELKMLSLRIKRGKLRIYISEDDEREP